MIYLTYIYSRDIFKGQSFVKWISDLFGEEVKFYGYESGRRYPSISINVIDFDKVKDKIPTKNLVKVKGAFNVIQQLSLGISDFSNDLRDSEFKNKQDILKANMTTGLIKNQLK